MELEAYVNARRAIVAVIMQSHDCISLALRDGINYDVHKHERAFMEDILIKMDEFGKEAFGREAYCDAVMG